MSSTTFPVGRGLTIAAVVAGLALLVWLVALIASFATGCPAGSVQVEWNAGGVSAWPPALNCEAASWSLSHEALPWADAVIVALAVVGIGAVLLGGALQLVGHRRVP